jgi:5'-3' exonuclease, N-terminal resolvase-like domain/T4 RNase H, C terminal
MILLDLNQIVVSNIMQQINISKNDNIEEDFLRHMILNSIRSVKSKFGEDYGELVICSDSFNYWRKGIFPQYKANRKKSRDSSIFDWNAIFKTINKIKSEIRENFPYHYLEIPTCEADDIIATLTQRYSSSEKILIISGDKDFVQLQKYPNVSQYSTIMKSWIKEDHPKRYLLEKVLNGDSGDGVPNFLSDDDTFVTEGKRQKRLTKKKIEQILSCAKPESIMTSSELAGYMRNKYLIDFDYIPDDLQKSILEEFNKPIEVTSTHVYRYLMKNGLKNLLNNIGDF